MKIFNVVVLKNLDNIIRKLKFKGANNCIHLYYLPASFTASMHEFISMKIIKIPRAKSCEVTIVYTKSCAYYGYMTMKKSPGLNHIRPEMMKSLTYSGLPNSVCEGELNCMGVRKISKI